MLWNGIETGSLKATVTVVVLPINVVAEDAAFTSESGKVFDELKATPVSEARLRGYPLKAEADTME